MAVISFKTLNNNVQDAISTGKFPEKNLRELSAGLKESQKKEIQAISWQLTASHVTARKII